MKPTKLDAAGEATEMKLTQYGLIDRITNLGQGLATPVESSKPLTRDVNGDPYIEDFNFN